MSIYFKEKQSNVQQSTPPLIIGLSASLGSGKNLRSTILHFITLCSNLDCKEISSLVKQEDLDDLEANIPSPLSDKIICASLNSDFNELKDLIKEVARSICDQSALKGLEVEKLGEPEFENRLVLENDRAAIRGLKHVLIGLKYLWELNLLIMRIEDFPIDYCIKTLNVFLKESRVENPTKAEEEFRENMKLLIDYMTKNRSLLINNEKLNKLVNLVNEKHTSNSKGLFFYFYDTITVNWRIKAWVHYKRKTRFLSLKF